MSDMERAFIVATTGYGGPGEGEKALAAGCDLHMVKPIDLEELETVLLQRLS